MTVFTIVGILTIVADKHELTRGLFTVDVTDMMALHDALAHALRETSDEDAVSVDEAAPQKIANPMMSASAYG
eukprot:SAG22_NODE_1732_length_3700_cov_2.112746_4_plen_73_part_00